METICPTSLVPDSSWFIGQGKSTKWTKEENKKFESALAVFDEKTPNRWFKVAAMIPGKSVFDVINQYRELVADVSDIEAGLVPVPGYLASPFTLELSGYRGFDVCRKKGRTCDQERKKGVPWTEDEHRRFLLGLQKYGKGDWRSISRHFVVSKTPTQVASHAQKYYLRQLSGGKDKKRPSIHDITTVDLIDTTSPSDNNRPHRLEKINELTFQQKLDEALTVFDSSCGDSYSSCGDSYAAYPFNVSTQSHPSSCLHIQVPRFRG